VFEVELFGQSRSQILNANTQITPHDPSVFNQPFHDGARQVCGDRKTDALVATAAGEDGGVYSHQPAVGIHERAPGVAGIDGGVSLDEILVVQAQIASVFGADNSHRHRLANTKGIANRQHHIADFDLVAVSQFDGRQV